MQILMPQLGETVTEGTIVSWHRREGESIAADDLLFEIETDKVATEVIAPAAGVLARIFVQAGQTVPVGTLLAEISVAGAAPTIELQSPGVSETNTAATVVSTGALAPLGNEVRTRAKHKDAKGRPLSPAVRRLVQEHGVEVDQLEGSGRNGRVRRQDVLQHLHSHQNPRKPAASMIPFNRLRKRTAEHMVRSKATSPHVLQAVEVDFGTIAGLRESLKDSWRERHGHSLSFLPFVAHAVCRSLAEFPLINASVEGESLRVHDAVNLAIAVDLNFDGLVAPVVRNAQALSIAALARAIDDLTGRARGGKLSPDDLKLGTYTISNSGSFGTMITAPIINQPQVAILSMDGIRKRPWVMESAQGDAIAIRPVGVIAQSFDHRAIDGAYSAAFLRDLKQRLESTNWCEMLQS